MGCDVAVQSGYAVAENTSRILSKGLTHKDGIKQDIGVKKNFFHSV